MLLSCARHDGNFKDWAQEFVPAHPRVVSDMFFEKQPQILRLTTPKLKSAWGPVRSG